jgi:Type I phosphodiesterase / nucleotide pyrophosphatase/Domain of unknown function (DUF4983)/Concanavalin A-like lectin/glucanases superfamily
MKNKIFKILLVTGSLLSIGYMGCKKFDNPPPFFEEIKTLNTVQRKVLVISIDGVTGSELKTIAPPKMEELKKTGKYNYDVLKGTMATDVASWASIVTGVGYSKHLINSNDFLPTPKENSHDVPTVYRNVLDYVLQFKAVKTSVVTPWQNLRNYLKIADFAPVVSTDLAVRDSTINLLNTQSQLGTVIVNFREVQAAGLNGGYLASNATYKDAILKADGYVGDILTALKARKSYANEDWLIIVTTNHGGSDVAPQGGFIIVSNPALLSRELKKDGYAAPLFATTTSRATPSNNNSSLFDPGLTGDLTVQMDAKFNSTNVNYPCFLSKSTNLTGGTITGWQWDHYGNGWQVTVGGSANGGSGKLQINAVTPPNTDWHTLTMTIKTTVNGSNVPTARVLKMYIDGTLEATADILARKSFANTEIFRVGHRAGDTDTPTPFYGANLTYFNIALDDATVKANFNLKNITQHPNYANLIGFWPMSEGAESILSNKISGGTDLSLSGTYTWANLQGLYPPGTTLQPATGSISVISTPSDITALIMYWMNIEIKPDYGIDGNPFLNKFEIEFIK